MTGSGGWARWRPRLPPCSTAAGTFSTPPQRITDQDDHWRLPTSDGPKFAQAAAAGTDILDDFENSIDRAFWAKAPLHEAADDIVNGADTYQVHRELARFEARSDDDFWALTTVVATRGQWASTRQAAAGYQLESESCGPCDREKETLHHRAWSCERITGSPDYDKSQHPSVPERGGRPRAAAAAGGWDIKV